MFPHWCLRCSEQWEDKREIPKRCKHCGTRLWNKPRKRGEGGGRHPKGVPLGWVREKRPLPKKPPLLEGYKPMVKRKEESPKSSPAEPTLQESVDRVPVGVTAALDKTEQDMWELIEELSGEIEQSAEKEVPEPEQSEPVVETISDMEKFLDALPKTSENGNATVKEVVAVGAPVTHELFPEPVFPEPPKPVKVSRIRATKLKVERQGAEHQTLIDPERW
jgi:DNA-directed RNA polymerase subunit RPC12/RpoP